MEDGGGTAVALEDCGSTAALGGDIGRWFKYAVAALGGSGGRRTCKDGIGVSVGKAKGLYYNVGVSVGEDGERGCV